MDIKLVKGQRYLFHNQQFDFSFRANFIDIITRDDGYKTLRVDKYSYESNNKLVDGFVAMPYNWIDKIETLVDIISSSNVDITNNSKNICCDDVLLEIDSFL